MKTGFIFDRIAIIRDVAIKSLKIPNFLIKYINTTMDASEIVIIVAIPISALIDPIVL